jgi:hypothetical protein
MKQIEHSLKFITELDENDPTAKRLLSLPKQNQIAMLEGMLKQIIGELHTRRNELTDKQFPKYIYMYSVALASRVADLTTKVLLTEDQMSDLVDSINEMENLSETILEENE